MLLISFIDIMLNSLPLFSTTPTLRLFIFSSPLSFRQAELEERRRRNVPYPTPSLFSLQNAPLGLPTMRHLAPLLPLLLACCLALCTETSTSWHLSSNKRNLNLADKEIVFNCCASNQDKAAIDFQLNESDKFHVRVRNLAIQLFCFWLWYLPPHCTTTHSLFLKRKKYTVNECSGEKGTAYQFALRFPSLFQ